MKRGALTLTFDDGHQHILDHIVPLLDSQAIPGVFAIPLNIDYQPWLKLNSRHEIAAHGLTHTDLTRLSTSQLEQELATPQIKLKANTLVYPGGAHTAQTVAKAKQYYSAARTVIYGFNSLYPNKPFQLRTINWSQRNWSLVKANLFATYAWLTNQWLVETYHHITDENPIDIHTVPFHEFKQHVGFIAKLPIIKTTIQDQL